jgi:multidrug efflux system membrane fusion protein
VIDNEIDTSTGTIKLKATFPNDDLKLWPGQFVNARAMVDSFDGLVVPSSVIQHGPNGEYAYVVKDNIAHVQSLSVARTQDGEAFIAAPASGLSAGDLVVVDGQYRLQDGSKVEYKEPSAPTERSLAAHSRTNGASDAVQMSE